MTGSGGIATPDRSGEQRLEGLAEANRVRSVRAEWKRQLAARELAAFSLLDEPDAQTMRVRDLLLAVPKYGHVKVDHGLMRARVSPAKRVGGLSDRQRQELPVYFPRAVRP